LVGQRARGGCARRNGQQEAGAAAARVLKSTRSRAHVVRARQDRRHGATEGVIGALDRSRPTSASRACRRSRDLRTTARSMPCAQSAFTTLMTRRWSAANRAIRSSTAGSNVFRTGGPPHTAAAAAAARKDQQRTLPIESADVSAIMKSAEALQRLDIATETGRRSRAATSTSSASAAKRFGTVRRWRTRSSMSGWSRNS
jgi:hypothetical protein